MTNTPHRQTVVQVDAMRSMAVLADPAQISATIEGLMACAPSGHGAARTWVARSRLDPDVVAFLTRARSLTLATTAALRAVLDIHAPQVQSPPIPFLVPIMETPVYPVCPACRTRQPCRTVSDLGKALNTELSGPHRDMR